MVTTYMFIVMTLIIRDGGSIVGYRGSIGQRSSVMGWGGKVSQWGIMALVVTHDALGGDGMAIRDRRRRCQESAESYDLKTKGKKKVISTVYRVICLK